MVCEVCQKSLASFSILISSWSITNDWNDDEDMKENDLDDYGMVEVKKEAIDNFADLKTNSRCTVDTDDGAKVVKKIKGNDGLRTIVKIESSEISDTSDSVPVKSKGVKIEEKEEDEDSEMGDVQLKNEEIDIKDEEG